MFALLFLCLIIFIMKVSVFLSCRKKSFIEKENRKQLDEDDLHSRQNYLVEGGREEGRKETSKQKREELMKGERQGEVNRRQEKKAKKYEGIWKD